MSNGMVADDTRPREETRGGTRCFSGPDEFRSSDNYLLIMAPEIKLYHFVTSSDLLAAAIRPKVGLSLVGRLSGSFYAGFGPLCSSVQECR